LIWPPDNWLGILEQGLARTVCENPSLHIAEFAIDKGPGRSPMSPATKLLGDVVAVDMASRAETDFVTSL
jgi:hypothetical protein